MNEGDDEIVLAFLEESRENLAQLDDDLVALEKHPDDPELLAKVFRTIHTIKGTCGFLGFHQLEALTHAGESLLAALRDGDLRLDAAITTSLLRLIDTVSGVLTAIEATGAEGETDHAPVIADLAHHLSSPREPLVDEHPDGPVHADPTATTPSGAETTVRVDVAVLDKLMDLVGELVLARSQIGELTDEDDEGPLASPYRQLHLITGELQDGVMQARLQPIGTVTGKFRRLVRDLAGELGKRIRIDIDGEDVGVDKAVNEALRDPLLHLVRNAADHGIETPEERVAAGKSPEGTITLRAFHQGGRVHVELSDDGRGIDSERLVRNAVAGGLLTAEDAAELSPRDALLLMFRAGLSTKEEITNLSGRGVGMDVVRSTLESVGGNIEVTSEFGRGSVFRINVPLTLAIMPALVAWCGGSRYAIPQVDIHEVLHLGLEDREATVHDVDGALMHRLRGRLLPLIDLADVFGVSPVRAVDGTTVVVVVESAGSRAGFIVDAVGDPIEAVVKPLTAATRASTAFAGVTILSDGRPALLLDVAGVAQAAGLVSGRQEDVEDMTAAHEDAEATLLLAWGADGGRFALPLPAVQRLERFATMDIERSGGLDVVQYGGGILPLIRIDEVLVERRVLPRDERRSADGEHLQVVVCETSAGLVGLIVEGVDDVAPEPPDAPQPPSRPGVAASLVVNERATELLDIEALVVGAGLARSA